MNGQSANTDGELEVALAPLTGDSPLAASCRYIVSTPGKQFRAAVLEGAAGYGERTADPLIRQSAIAIELFHAATLAHDDVVDDGRLRRGKETIGAHAGNLAASLSGGWLFARAAEMIAAAGEEASILFAEAAAVVCEGEMWESRDLHDVDRTCERYLAVIGAKTAKLIAFSGWLGAAVSGAPADTRERLESYGEAIGMAFQIADDIIDLVGDPAQTGKTPGNDLRQGVYALPTIYALREDACLRDSLLHGPEENDLPELVERIRATGAVERALEECRDWIERAAEALPSNAPAGAHERRLRSLADTVGARAKAMT
jgi:heptaprenyl diphosphate synthase